MLTATGEYLDNRVIERGVRRYQATRALRRGDFATQSGQPLFIPMDSRFSTIDDTDPIIFRVVSVYADEHGNR